MVRILSTPRMILVGFVMLAAALWQFLMPVGAAPPQQETYPGETPTVAPIGVLPEVATPEVTGTPEVIGTPTVPPATGGGMGGGNSQSAPLMAIGGAIALAAGAAVVWRIGSRPHRSS